MTPGPGRSATEAQGGEEGRSYGKSVPLSGDVCGARLVDHERGVIPELDGGSCARLVKPPRRSGCCDAHRVRLWDEAHPRLGRPHTRRVRQDATAIRHQILGLLMDGAWWTVWQLAERCRCMETTASAKLRDLRKKHFGAFVIIGRRLPDSCAYEYQLQREVR